MSSISPDLTDFVEFSRQFLSGGKRFRAQFCYWGWRSIAPADSDLSSIVSAAAALEIFHAAALVHDDIIDNSDTRRGAPSAHKLFEGLHSSSGWAGNSGEFGRASAILLGDLMLGWSDELLDDGLVEVPDTRAARAARVEFNRMRTEVTAGQYLDILEERAWLTQPASELLARAHRVIVFKSAKYSVQAPLVIGAALAGASAEQLAALCTVGLPLGIAFQLRDDLLGVFGDATVTGKPSGDDLREGKRTVLIAVARDNASDAVRNLIDEYLGDPELDTERISRLQQAILASGAVEQVEALIAQNVAEARAALTAAPIGPEAKAALEALTETVTQRTF
ncbi:geranylgeranyl diphosphate synthase type I [Leifsonia psychrotolerans]|uniref:Geranylgeranyl diphosphate synthase type I n=1 Tax=Glaciibacter psychrotolerans TaxID=670054 RepID=A0A7Z0EC59_9MICO|nr:geranylgeranyl diphosphate synthase type I [Leifsonia psychrotolerans]